MPPLKENFRASIRDGMYMIQESCPSKNKVQLLLASALFFFLPASGWPVAGLTALGSFLAVGFACLGARFCCSAQQADL